MALGGIKSLVTLLSSISVKWWEQKPEWSGLRKWMREKSRYSLSFVLEDNGGMRGGMMR